MKTAILQVADTGPLESLVIMLRSAGYTCLLPNRELRDLLRRVGCDLVLDIDTLVNGWGYSRPMSLPLASPEFMAKADLYIDIKAHRCHGFIGRRWPELKGRVLWYRINGGKPEHVIKTTGEDCGDEVNPGCPILTPNQWYKNDPKAYTCWPPFYRADEYFPKYGRVQPPYDSPVCLIHNLTGWGYGALVPKARALGIRCFGNGSPDGLVKHHEVARMLSRAIASVHLKSSDAPGYALYESLAAACPVICTRRLIWRCHMEELLIPGKTCLVFDRETHDPLSPDDAKSCEAEIAGHLERLSDPKENQKIGMAGLERLKRVMWSESRDSGHLQDWLSRMFP